ncbi:MAG TPA: uracil-DNA glycosylase family protein [Chloroflexota bacterium]
MVKCFISPRVPIYTADGYKPIKDVKLGDLVLTHRGRFRKVVYIRPREVLPEGSDVVRLTVQEEIGAVGNHRPVRLTVTPEHPFLVDGQWRTAGEIRPGDKLRVLADRCEVCGRAYFVRYDRYQHRTYRTCSYRCHNRRIFHSPEARAKVRRAMVEQYGLGSRDRWSITARANERTRELVAAGQATLQHLTSEQRRRGRLIVAQRINEGLVKHRIGYGEYELATILDRLGVPYQHHFTLPDSTLSYDFCLPEQRILVEVRGPGFQRSSDAEARAAVKDELADQHGYMVVNLWWQQIVQRPGMVEAMLGRLLKNHVGAYAFVDLTVVRAETRQTRRDFPLYNIGVEEDESYVAAGLVSHNCRPPGNRDPQPDEIAACSDYLSRQTAALKPRLIVTLGRHSLGRFLPGQPISRIHGVPRKVGTVTVFPMYHPAAALHQPTLRKTLLEDMAKLPGILAELERAPEVPAASPPPPEPPRQLNLF